MNNNSATNVADPSFGKAWLGTYRDTNGQVMYDLAKASNYNACVCGTSGSGKTYFIRELIKRVYIPLGVTLCILDVHDDYAEIPGLDESYFNHIELTYTDQLGTINPLKVDPNSGTYMPIRHMLAVTKMFNPNMGSTQQGLLRNVLSQVYVEAGIIQENRDTWTKSAPTLQDVLTFIINAKNAASMGLTNTFVKNVRKALKKDEISDDEFHGLGKKLCSMVERVDKSIEKVWNAKAMESLESIVATMVSTSLFGEDNIRLRPGMVNRFSLKSLHESDQLIMAHLLMDRTFTTVLHHNEKKYRPAPELMMILDEGKLVKSISRSPMSPLNRIATEARGFGMGMLFGVQSIEHLTGDTQKNCSMFTLLTVPATEYSDAARRFQISKEELQRMTPHRDAMIYFNSGAFKNMTLFQ